MTASAAEGGIFFWLTSAGLTPTLLGFTYSLPFQMERVNALILTKSGKYPAERGDTERTGVH